MTKNERRMMLSLAKSVARLAKITDELAKLAPADQQHELSELSKGVESEIQQFIDWAKAEWRPNE